MFDEIGWLEEVGHEVGHFSTQHSENDSSPWSSYFVPYHEIGSANDLTARKQLLAAARRFWNRQTARKFARLLADFRSGVIHVHGIHRQISPPILVVAKRAGVPVV